MLKKINWQSTIVELLVVIVGVTIAFQLNNMKENGAKLDLEKKYVASLISDLESDIHNLDSLINSDEIRIKHIKRLYHYLAENTNMDSVDVVVPQLAYLSLFYPRNITYESMKTSGKLDLIQDLTIKNKIVELYEFTLVEKEEAEYYHRLLIDDYMIPLLMGNINYDGTFDRGILDKKFMNHVMSYIVTMVQKIAKYKLFRKNSASILKTLKEEYQ